MRNTPYIFVYGTLMNGYWIKESIAFKKIAKYENRGMINGMLFTNGIYPAAIATKSRFIVQGEIFIFKSTQKSLAFLDRYENAYCGNREYIRKILPVKLNHGKIVMASTYIYNKSKAHLKKIPTGKYSPSKKKKFSICMQLYI